MEIIRTVEWMKQVSRQARDEGRIVGLVPTMGALHAGHLSLVDAARRETSPVVVSIFVNPTQFGPGEDYERYPRSLEADAKALEERGVDVVFAPETKEMYPAGFSTTVNVGGLGERLEGRSRPGHFRGVATVVMKLFAVAAPARAYFGRKDAQQARLIQKMTRDLTLDPEIVVCPIVREADGLARSSRNAYLSAEERRAATVLHRALDAARRAIEAGERDAARLTEVMNRVLAGEPLARPEYVEVADADTFERAGRLRGSCLALLAVRIGTTRLIDNMLIEATDPGGRVICCL